MSTNYYKLPTVCGDSTLSVPDAVNGLAIATDAVLQDIQDSFVKNPYELPPATTETPGGVRIGEGFRVYADGLLEVDADTFIPQPATANKLGCVSIGSNIDATADGKISLGIGAYDFDTINTQEIANGAITGDKIAEYAVLVDHVDPTLLNKIAGIDQMWTNAQKVQLCFANNAASRDVRASVFGYNPPNSNLWVFSEPSATHDNSVVWWGGDQLTPQPLYYVSGGSSLPVQPNQFFSGKVSIWRQYWIPSGAKWIPTEAWVCVILDGLTGTWTLQNFNEPGRGVKESARLVSTVKVFKRNN